MAHLDIKVLLAAAVGCYGLVALVLGTLLAAMFSTDGSANASPTWVVGLMGLATISIPPLVAGYFTARYASNRPQLHVLLVALLGGVLILLMGGSIWVGLVSFPLAALGAFLQLRGQRHAT
jgi:hypothetical protein